MSTPANQQNIGALITVTDGAAPVNSSAGTLTAIAIDRGAHPAASAVIYQSAAAPTGTPDSYSLISTIQHCATSGGSYVDYKPDGTNVATLTTAAALSTGAKAAMLDVSLLGAMRYIKIVPVLAFVNGTSPKAVVATTVILGGLDTQPVA